MLHDWGDRCGANGSCSSGIFFVDARHGWRVVVFGRYSVVGGGAVGGVVVEEGR